MVGRLTRRQTWLVGFILLAVWAITIPAHAQGGTVQGVVKDGKGVPADGATVVIQSADGKKTQVKTDKKGAFSQAGVAAGDYLLTGSKGDLVTVPTPVRVSASGANVDLLLVDKKTAAAALATDKAEAAKVESNKTEFTTLFNAGATASGAGNQDEAIAKFNAAHRDQPCVL